MNAERTEGEKAMNCHLASTDNMDVSTMRNIYASLYDRLHMYSLQQKNPKILRMLSIAKTELETSQMWCVKALTFHDD